MDDADELRGTNSGARALSRLSDAVRVREGSDDEEGDDGEDVDAAEEDDDGW